MQTLHVQIARKFIVRWHSRKMTSCKTVQNTRAIVYSAFINTLNLFSTVQVDVSTLQWLRGPCDRDPVCVCAFTFEV